jgi:hypothetical protein
MRIVLQISAFIAICIQNSALRRAGAPHSCAFRDAYITAHHYVALHRIAPPHGVFKFVMHFTSRTSTLARLIFAGAY